MRREDPYQERARQLCVAAGVDPDSRTGEGRGQPAWCSYRQAARDEHNAAEQVALAVYAPRTDAPEPLIVGTHDEQTIAQMRNCMAYGDAAAGVILADGHLGYAQPVGGVIAYRDQISVSGVGFDIACFTGDTRIYTLDNKNPRLRDIVGKEVYIMACKPGGELVATKAYGTKTRRQAKLIEVRLDSGAKIRCTPDHLFMLRNGSYRKASELLGASLMPFYYTSLDGWLIARHNYRDGTHPLKSIHSIVAKSGLLGRVPRYKYAIHHKDHTRHNNHPNNLEFWRFEKHAAYHMGLRDLTYMTTNEFEENRISGIKNFWEHARNDKEFMGRRANVARVNGTQGALSPSDSLQRAWQENGRRGASYLSRFNTSTEVKKKLQRRMKDGLVCPICKEKVGITALSRHTDKWHPEVMDQIDPSARISMSKQILNLYNHKVVGVQSIPVQADVYCLNVPKYNNFALAAGVFVHNCGNMAVKLDTKFQAIEKEVPLILADIARTISFGVGRTNDERVDHALFESDLWRESDREDYKQKAHAQLGTVGSGNHYVDLMRDTDDNVWIGVHFGSRGLGHSTATKYLKLGGGKDGINVPPTVLDATSALGQAYIAGMKLGGMYAYAGREWVVERVRKILGGRVLDSIHNHHNFAWTEMHGGEVFWVVRKGATPAFPGERGFVGGSMGDDCVILEGVESERSAQLLYSTVHGAGRLFGRKEAKRRFKRVDMDSWLRSRGVMLIGADLDESPMAYRRLPEVLAEHAGTVNILHTLRPFAVVMAGAGEFDPFKD